MKKLILGSAILAVLGMSANAMAANNGGSVHFSGSVSTATCEISLKNSNGTDLTSVDLGSVSTTATQGTMVGFKLIPQDTTCLNKAAATMTWNSSTLNALGLGNNVANGTNAVMLLATTNSTAATNSRNIKQGNTTFEYNVANGIKSFDFQAVLAKPDANTAFTAGAFAADANYTIAYK
ncbi:fimbrial protein [Citrobacter amalonaticus]